MWWLLFVLWSALLAYGDLRYRKISNTLIVCALCGELLWTGTAVLVSGWDYPPLWPGWRLALAGFLAAVPFFLLWQRRWMGGGDVKAIAVYGFALGPLRLALVLAVASVVAGLHAVLYLVASRRCALQAHWSRIPYAAYMGFGALSVAFTPLSSAWSF